jgi:hypothetical protein
MYEFILGCTFGMLSILMLLVWGSYFYEKGLRDGAAGKKI